MHPKSPKLLDDVVRSCQYIVEDTEGETLDTYLDNSRLRTADPDTAALITDLNQIIALRNRLAHGYDEEIDDALVWRAVQESLPVLWGEAETLLPAFEP